MLGETCVVTRLIKICRRLHCEVRGHRTERRVFDATGSVLTHGPRARLSNGPRSASSDGKVCMAEVCLTAPAVLSPISPNERRKRRHGYDSHVAEGCGANWYKRHRTGHSFVRKLLHLRGFSLNVQQAEELVRFIDQFPAEMDKVRVKPSSSLFFPTALAGAPIYAPSARADPPKPRSRPRDIRPKR